MKKANLLFIAFSVLGLFSYAQDTIHVPAYQPTIQDGIDAADDGDIVLVAQGTYVENIDFDGKAIRVASHWLVEQDSAHILNTIIDGSEPANPAQGSVVRFTSGEDTTSVLCGFTITGGTGSYNADWDAWGGGGILLMGGSGKIIHNRIVDNQVVTTNQYALGGGIDAEENAGIVIIRDNYIADNKVMLFGATGNIKPLGGGIEIYMQDYIVERNIIVGNYMEGPAYGCGIQAEQHYSTGIIRNNIIESNSATISAEEDYGIGGGIQIATFQPGLEISGNKVSDNSFTGIGTFDAGGIWISNNQGGGVILEGNLVSNNKAQNGGGITVWMTSPDCHIANNMIVNNEADLDGGGILLLWNSKKEAMAGPQGRIPVPEKSNMAAVSDTIPMLINNTIAGNTCVITGGGIYAGVENTDMAMFNNIIHGNQALFGNDLSLNNESDFTTYLYYNNLNTDEIDGPGSWEGGSNIYADPEFYLETYHLIPTSPCKDAGTDYVDVNGNYYYAPEQDFDREDRPVDGTFDIGADEWFDYSTPVEKMIVQEQQKLSIYPNPVKGHATVVFDLPETGNVKISMHDINGRHVSTVVSGRFEKGSHQVRLDAGSLRNGIYFCTLRTGQGVAIGRIVKVD